MKKPSTEGKLAVELVRFYCERFKEVRDRAPSDVSWGRDAAILKRLLKAGQTEEDLRRGIEHLIADPDRFVRGQSWSLRLLPSRLSGYLDEPWWEPHLKTGESFERDGKTVRVRRDYGDIVLEERRVGGAFHGFADRWVRVGRLG